MRRRATWSRALGLALAGAPAATAGCAGWLYPVPRLGPDVAARCAALPDACRNHVYVFLLGGEDPFDTANLSGVRDALIAMGYIKVYRGDYHHLWYFEDEIRRVHREDETARFAVLGFGLGANAARDVAEGVRPDGVPIDLLVYCGGNALPNGRVARPENALRVVNVLGRGAGSAAPALDGAENVQLSDVSHFGSPTHAFTLQLLAQELTEAASRVPVADLRAAGSPAVEGGPPPGAAARQAMQRDEWDFLRPAPASEPPPMPKAP